MSWRSNKRDEIKNSFTKININIYVCEDLPIFYSELDNWVDTGKPVTGIINLVEIEKDIIYQLDTPNTTVVKLSEENKMKIDKKLELKSEPESETESEPKIKVKIGRNESCSCKSGKKYKRCCLRY